MDMQLDIDFVAFMRIIGLIMALVAAIGVIVIPLSLRKHNEERERKMTNAPRSQYWDTDTPDGLGHR